MITNRAIARFSKTPCHTESIVNIAVFRRSRLATNQLGLFYQPKLFKQSYWLIGSAVNTRSFAITARSIF